jgi:hypothetical protein
MAVRLGWRWNGGTPIPLATLLDGERRQSRKCSCGLWWKPGGRPTPYSWEKHLGLHPASPLPVGQLVALMTAFRRMWSPIRWGNASKEAWWRLTVAGIPFLGNSHVRGVRPGTSKQAGRAG